MHENIREISQSLNNFHLVNATNLSIMGAACTILEGNEEAKPGTKYLVVPGKGARATEDSLAYSEGFITEQEREARLARLKEPTEPSVTIIQSIKTDAIPAAVM